MGQELKRSLAFDWSELRQIRHEIGDLLCECPRELREATTMAASELLENAIKYSHAVPGAHAIEFSLRVALDCLRIEVANCTTDAATIARLTQRICELSCAKDRAALCIERLEESVRPPFSPGGRGLYRIGSDGGFDLACTVVDNVVTVVATRRLQ